MASAVDTLTAAIEALWKSGPLPPGRPHDSSSFRHLMEICTNLFPDAVGSRGEDRGPDFEGLGWALRHFLLSSGAMASATSNNDVAIDPKHVARALVDAMRMSTTQVFYLCPLDRAGQLPELRFGPCEVRQFTSTELNRLVQVDKLKNWRPGYVFDSKAFAQFSWLVVTEREKVPTQVGRRAMPFLYQEIDWQYGSIQPHKNSLPPPVESALFALLLLPWECLVDHSDLEWRGFQIPWTHFINADPFTHPTQPPSADTLSWEPCASNDPNGGVVETQRPIVHELLEGSTTDLPLLASRAWADASAASKAQLFNPLVAHFLVRAFISDGIDEFLWHMTSMEAALGMKEDYEHRGGGSGKLRSRIAAITKRSTAADEYRDLFEIRSQFVHGRNLNTITAEKRVNARSLAREVASKLVEAAVGSTHLTREEFLKGLG